MGDLLVFGIEKVLESRGVLLVVVPHVIVWRLAPLGTIFLPLVNI